MAHTKAKGSTKNGRDSEAKRLGVKLFDGQHVNAGGVIIRQRGTRYCPGENVLRAGDDTLYAKSAGTIKFSDAKKTRFDGSTRMVKVVNVLA